MPKLPYVVERAAGAVVGGTGYMLGGLIPGDSSISTILSIDLRTGSSRRVGSLPIAAHDAAAVSMGNEIILFGGSGNAGNLVQRFDPATGATSTIGHLPRVLSDLAAVTIGNSIFVAGGYDGTRARPEVLETAAGRSFRVAATLPVGLRYAAVAVAGSKLLVAGGQTDSASASRSVYLVDPSSGSVRRLAEVPGRPTARVWQISVTSGRISPSSPLALPLADPTLLAGATRTIIAGGATGLASSGGETNEEILFT
ncbi:MAG: hypothetical protein E6G59_03915 [Actinobacteria bacterium]|nr:MAG: hypothetical protein E6G59_03915 [Actinomycetota bacterium]